MSSDNRKLLTIVSESALEVRLIKDVEALGAHGYTITDARGKGRRGVRDAGWDQSGNIRMDIVCDEATASAIAAYLKQHYYDDYAMILYTSDVNVLRPDKF